MFGKILTIPQSLEGEAISMEVKFAQAEQMNLIGYFLRDMLRTSLANESGKKVAHRLRGSILFNVNGMEVTLVFRDENIELHQGSLKPLDARIRGDLTALLDVAIGESYWKALLTGDIKVSGNLLKLLRLIKLLRINN